MMRIRLRYIFSMVCLILIMFFCVGSSSAVTDTQLMTGYSIPEPVNMLLLGIGLIGMGTFMKSRFSR